MNEIIMILDYGWFKNSPYNIRFEGKVSKQRGLNIQYSKAPFLSRLILLENFKQIQVKL